MNRALIFIVAVATAVTITFPGFVVDYLAEAGSGRSGDASASR